MKQLKFYFLAGLSFLLCTGLAHAQALKDGQIKVFQKTGDVQLLSADGSKKPLSKGDVFGDGTIVIAGEDGHALLVFSNGTTMKVDPNGQLEIKTFKQAPFDEKAAGGTFIALVQDPSQSVTDLNLINGNLQGEVKHLDESAGSKFTVDTPAGSAGIRGTVIAISVTRDPTTGAVTSITCNCFVGAMNFTPHGGHARPVAPGTGTGAATGTGPGTGVSVPAGAQIQVTLTVNPTTGAISGVNLGGASLSTATSGQALAAIFQSINAARTDPAINPTPLAPVVVPTAPPPTAVAPAPPPVVTTTTNPTTGAVTQTVVSPDNTVTTTTTSTTGVETTTVVGPSNTVVATAVTTPATATTPATTVSTVVAPDNTVTTSTATTNPTTGTTQITTVGPNNQTTTAVVPTTSVVPPVQTAQNQVTLQLAAVFVTPIQVAPAAVAPPAPPAPPPPPPVVVTPIPVTPAPTPTPTPPTTNTPPVNTNPTISI